MGMCAVRGPGLDDVVAGRSMVARRQDVVVAEDAPVARDVDETAEGPGGDARVGDGDTSGDGIEGSLANRAVGPDSRCEYANGGSPSKSAGMSRPESAGWSLSR